MESDESWEKYEDFQDHSYQQQHPPIHGNFSGEELSVQEEIVVEDGNFSVPFGEEAFEEALEFTEEVSILNNSTGPSTSSKRRRTSTPMLSSSSKRSRVNPSDRSLDITATIDVDLTQEPDEDVIQLPQSDPPVWTKRALDFDAVEKIILHGPSKKNARNGGNSTKSVGHVRPSGQAAFQLTGATYVVNVLSLRDPKDIRADSLGSYNAKRSSYNRWYRLEGERYTRIVCSKEPPNWDGKILCTYGNNVSSGQRLKRCVYEFYDRRNNVQQFAAVTYSWLNGQTPFQFEVQAHRNRKKTPDSYIRAPTSLFKAGSENLQKMGVSAAVEVVSDDVGGVMGAARAGDMPRRKQFENLTRRMESPFKLQNRGPLSEDDDRLLTDLVGNPQSFVIARDVKKHVRGQKKKDGKIRARMVCVSPDMLSDLKRICIGEGPNKRPINTDTTFNMGKFFVTLLVTRDPMFLTTKYGTERLIVVGILFHGDREKDDFKYFAERVEEICQKSTNQPSEPFYGWVSDGDLSLIDGLKSGSFLFGKSRHVRCERHMVDNCIKKLNECGIVSERDQGEIITDIFGSEMESPFVPGTRIRDGGLVDLSATEFMKQYPLYRHKWGDPFFLYFEKNKVQEILESYLPDQRKWFLKGQPGRVTNNDSEIANLLAQQHQNFLKLPLQECVPKMQEFTESLKNS